MNKNSGLSLIEILIAVAIVVVVSGIGLLAYNPGGQLAASRNTERQLHLQTIMNAIRQNIADSSSGSFNCSSGSLPAVATKMTSGGGYNIAPCIAPTYIFVMPFDPSAAGARYVSNSDYDTGYNIVYSASTTQITLSAPTAELGKTISLTR